MITLASPAKVNLFLRILRRRSDGYHELASLFQTIALCDTLQVAFSDSDKLDCNDRTLPTGPSNLIWKAVNLFREKTGRQFCLRMFLDKRIPVKAGLGGGSSNAATALWAINTLLGNPVAQSEILQWAGEIGSDVPFFLSHGTAYCTGRGEIVQPIPLISPQSVSIFKPRGGLSTPQVYNNLNVDSLLQRSPEVSLQAFLNGSPEYYNDLELPAFKLMPTLLSLKKNLVESGFDHVLLAGSGAALVCFGEPRGEHFDTCNESIPFQYKTHFINRTPDKWYT
jgi:4-diphosphocytidyl-2-C-methyl-D-erythritol kinase